MKSFKKIVCLSLAAVMLFGLSACGKDEDASSSQVSTVSENTSSKDKLTEYTIGNLTVIEIMEILNGLTLNDGLTLELTKDGTADEYDSAAYSVKNADGKECATISVTSDLENKAATLDIVWDYNNTVADTNTILVTASKTIIIAVWPDYSEEYLEYVEKTVAFDTSFLNAFRNSNITYTAGAKSGFISAGMSSGTVYYTICYPNLVENV